NCGGAELRGKVRSPDKAKGRIRGVEAAADATPYPTPFPLAGEGWGEGGARPGTGVRAAKAPARSRLTQVKVARARPQDHAANSVEAATWIPHASSGQD